MVQRTKKSCSIDGCEKPVRARGWCSMHWQRWRKNNTEFTCSIEGCIGPVKAREYCSDHYYKWSYYGDPLAPNVYARSPEEAFQRYTKRQGDCLIWTAGQSADGYGVIHFDGKSHRPHRYAWERKHGPIPEGFEIDHICWNTICVNIRHLRLATSSQNGSYLKGANSTSKSGVRNVSWDRGKWRVSVRKNGKLHYFGRYSRLHEAALVAKDARKELFGEFAGKG